MPQIDRQQNVNVQRAVIIGVGGTGAQVLRRVRRLIMDRFGSFEDLPIVRFLYLDTDPQSIRELGSEIEEDIRLSASELVDAQIEDASGLYRGIEAGNFPHYDWFALERLRSFTNIAKGAGTVRQLGRLCFWQHYAEIRAALTAQIRAVSATRNADSMRERYGLNVDPGLNIHIVAGLAGGTGSGCFLDLAYLIRAVVEQLGVPGGHKSAAYLVLPGAYADLSGTNALPNGYAALKELNYLSYMAGTGNSLAPLFGRPEWQVQYATEEGSKVAYRDRPPFDYCYLLDSCNEHVQLHRNDIFAMVARSLFHDFALEFAGFKRALRANIEMQLTSNDRLDCPARFMSFGQSAVYFPLREVKEVLTHQLALRAVQQWVDRTAATLQVLSVSGTDGRSGEKSEGEDAVAASLTRAAADETVRGVVRGHLVGDFLPNNGFLAKDMLSALIADDKTRLVDVPYRLRENEKHRWINEKWPREAFQGHLTSAWQRWRGDFGDDGPDPTAWGEQIRWMVANRERALARYRKTIYEHALGAFHDGARGPAWALSFVQQLRVPLAKLRERLLEEANSAVAIAGALSDVYLINAARQNQGPSLSAIIERRIGEEYQALDEIVRENLLRFAWGGEERLRGQAYEYLTWASHWCRARVEERSRRLAAELCGQLLSALEDIERQVRETARVLAGIQARMTQLAREWAQKGATTENVGQLLYDPVIVQVLEQRIADLRGDAYDPVAVGERALSRLGLRLDRLHESDAPALLQALVQAAEEALGDLTEQQLTDTRFAAHDLLVATFPDQHRLDEALADTLRKGAPFVRLETNPPGGHWTPGGSFPAGLLRVRGAGLRGGYLASDQDSERVRVLRALERAGWNPANEVSPIGDSEQIVFIQECGGFPLRALSGITEMKRAYEHHQSSPQNPPLHLMRTEQAARFPDLLPPHPEDLERALQARTLGLALGILTPRDLPDGSGAGTTVRQWAFVQPIPETGGEQSLPLGETVDGIVMRLAYTPELAREILAVVAAQVADADEAAQDAYRAQLLAYLEGRKKQAATDQPTLLPDDNPIYAAEQARIVAFIRERGWSKV